MIDAPVTIGIDAGPPQHAEPASFQYPSAFLGVAITPDGAFAYVTNVGSDTVSVIDTKKNKVVATVPVGHFPFGVDITPF